MLGTWYKCVTVMLIVGMHECHVLSRRAKQLPSVLSATSNCPSQDERTKTASCHKLFRFLKVTKLNLAHISDASVCIKALASMQSRYIDPTA